MKRQILSHDLWIIFALGFSSGIPFLLILSTLSVWLAESGISKTNIGLFAWVTVPYSIKFLIAPLVDRWKIPVLTARLGQRRSWIIASQLALIMGLLNLGLTNPAVALWKTARWAFFVGLCSAVQDIVIESYRIEKLPNKLLGLGASSSVLGYRAGMLCSGAGALYLAAFSHSWCCCYTVMAGFISIGIVAVLLGAEPDKMAERFQHSGNYLDKLFTSWRALFRVRNFWVWLFFITFFKFADTILYTMSLPFLMEIGFDKIEIAHIAKTFGIAAMLGGGVLGGIVLSRQTLHYYLILCSGLQAVACLCFLLQAQLGHNLPMLFVTMGVENFVGGMSQVALIAYLSQLCLPEYSAIHYALLSSAASLIRVNLSFFAGWLADCLSWPNFYFTILLGSLPAMLILVYYVENFVVIGENR